MLRFLIAGALALVLAQPAEAGDVCALPSVVVCPAVACYRCIEAIDGTKYCSMGSCGCPQAEWQCRRDDGSVYSKPLFEQPPGLAPAGNPRWLSAPVE